MAEQGASRTLHGVPSQARAGLARLRRRTRWRAKYRSRRSRTGATDSAIRRAKRRETPQPIENARVGYVGGLHLLELEALAPGDHRPPDQLVDQHDDRDHRRQSPEDGAGVSGIGRGLQIRSKAGKAKVAVAQHEHLASHQEEPAAGHRHHGIPDQPDGRVGQLQLHEALPPTEAGRPAPPRAARAAMLLARNRS